MSTIESENTLNTGTAVGADHAFYERSNRLNEHIHLYSFDGYKNTRIVDTDTHKIKLVTLSEEENHDVVNFINKSLKCSKTNFTTYDYNLIRRNYYIIRDSYSLYAVGYFSAENLIKGFTGLTVRMFVDRYLESVDKYDHVVYLPVYFFDQDSELWYHLAYDSRSIVSDRLKFVEIFSVPKPSGKYAGVGTRSLTERGRRAIMDLGR